MDLAQEHARAGFRRRSRAGWPGRLVRAAPDVGSITAWGESRPVGRPGGRRPFHGDSPFHGGMTVAWSRRPLHGDVARWVLVRRDASRRDRVGWARVQHGVPARPGRRAGGRTGRPRARFAARPRSTCSQHPPGRHPFYLVGIFDVGARRSGGWVGGSVPLDARPPERVAGRRRRGPHLGVAGLGTCSVRLTCGDACVLRW